MSSTTFTASHVNQDRVEYEFTILQSMDEGLDLWEVVELATEKLKDINHLVLVKSQHN